MAALTKAVTSYLKGDAIPDFETFVVPIVEQLLKTAGLATQEHKWGIVARGCHHYGGSYKRPKEIEVKVMQDQQSTRRIDLKIHPGPKALYFYELSLNTAIPDQWTETVARLRRHATKLTSLTNGKHEEEEEIVTEKNATDSVLRNGVSRVEKVRNNLDAVLNLARDSEVSAELKAEAEAKFNKAQAKAGPLLDKLSRITADLTEAGRIAAEKSTMVQSLRKRLSEAELELVRIDDHHAKCKMEYTILTEASEPAKQELALAASELDECKRQEAERAKNLSKQPGLVALLAALEQLKFGGDND